MSAVIVALALVGIKSHFQIQTHSNSLENPVVADSRGFDNRNASVGSRGEQSLLVIVRPADAAAITSDKPILQKKRGPCENRHAIPKFGSNNFTTHCCVDDGRSQS